MEINRIKCRKPGIKIREITAGGGITTEEWKRILKKYSS
jgi:hypothetical protein